MIREPVPDREAQALLIVPRRGRWMMLISLVFLAATAVDFLEHARGIQRVAGIAALAAFVATYARVMLGRWAPDRPVDDDRQAIAGVVALAALSAALMAVGGADWSGTWCFTAAATGLHVDRRVGLPAIVVLSLVAGAAELSTGAPVGGAASLALVTFGVGLLTGGFRRLRVLNVELGRARDEIARLAVADERLRFARDLHDLLGHSLSVVALKGELASRLLPEHPEQAGAHVRDIQAVSRRALAEVREAVAGYRRPVLSAELAGARSALEAAGIEVEADAAPAADLPPDAEAVLAWAVREGATNVLRHAHAHRVRISLNITGRDAALEMVDDGRSGAGDDAAGTGLAGLAERVARVRGRLDAAPHPDGAGFRLAVTVPLGGVS